MGCAIIAGLACKRGCTRWDTIEAGAGEVQSEPGNVASHVLTDHSMIHFEIGKLFRGPRVSVTSVVVVLARVYNFRSYYYHCNFASFAGVLLSCLETKDLRDLVSILFQASVSILKMRDFTVHSTTRIGV